MDVIAAEQQRRVRGPVSRHVYLQNLFVAVAGNAVLVTAAAGGQPQVAVDRRLHGPEQFVVCVGREARVTLRDGRVVEGKIAEPTENVVEIETEEGAVRVFFDDISRAQLVVKGIG